MSQTRKVKESVGMVFARMPENDFAQYIETYYEKCRHYYDRIEAIAGKWMFRDLIPGMSDFDTRFIVRDGMTAEDWCHMSTAIGEAHLQLCRKYACWNRNLEHLPGINLTWSELLSERTYYPEYEQWSFYITSTPEKLAIASEWLARRPWDKKDELFHLKKFLRFYGRYDRTIDPAVNLGVHQNKYPLHSRLMHYFTPAVQSAMSLIERRNIAGKFDALEIAQRRFPDLKCWSSINEIISMNYAIPKWYCEPFLSELENELEIALDAISLAMRDYVSILPAEVGTNVNVWRRALQRTEVDPALIIFESAKFSRLMKGRLQFYAQAPSHFESSWLIRNELKRSGQNFLHTPLTVYWKLRTGESVNEPALVLDRLHGDLLTAEEVVAAREFARLTAGRWQQGQEKAVALAIVAIFDDVFKALSKISQAVYEPEAANVI